MSSFYGLFSLGGLVGAGVAGLEMSLGVDDVQHAMTITILSVLAVVSVLRWLVPSPPQQALALAQAQPQALTMSIPVRLPVR